MLILTLPGGHKYKNNVCLQSSYLPFYAGGFYTSTISCSLAMNEQTTLWECTGFFFNAPLGYFSKTLQRPSMFKQILMPYLLVLLCTGKLAIVEGSLQKSEFSHLPLELFGSKELPMQTFIT